MGEKKNPKAANGLLAPAKPSENILPQIDVSKADQAA